MRKILFSTILYFLIGVNFTYAQKATLTGRVVTAKDGTPVEYASILLNESGLWAVTDQQGLFTIHHISPGKVTLSVRCLGYAPYTRLLDLKDNNQNLRIPLQASNLKLNEVQVVARRKENESTTSYTIGRQALDNQQILNLSDVTALLPGGKTVNSTLIDNNRIGLRSQSNEKGNSSFGTAIEVDGVRINNNAEMGETLGAGTRNLSSSNIEGVEIITGIPSVEYGDLSNGLIKVKTRRGKSPLVIEGKINQYTTQTALNKGLDLGHQGGLLNLSFEHARSFSDASSPHTAYQRNVFSANYMNVFMKSTRPVTLNAGITGKLGGYNSKADPDQDREDYSQSRDNTVNGHLSLNWLLEKKWITNLSLSTAINYTDRLSTDYTNTNSASTQPYIHAFKEGYNIAENYDDHPDASIILGPTGYWYVKRYIDSKPLDYNVKLKAIWHHLFGKIKNQFLIGTEYTNSQNKGRGLYYTDMRYAPTWREYRYDKLPSLDNMTLYGENKMIIPVKQYSSLTLSAGIREDITSIHKSDYGTVSSISPRFNSRYVFWQNQHKKWITGLSIYAGWGKSVKLPSFQVLYPSPSYSDQLAFSSTSDTKNKSYYAYYTYPEKKLYNPDLKWQYNHQTDIGIELKSSIFTLSVSAFYSKTFNPYMATEVYTPFTYKYTSPTALQKCDIPATNRQFTINPTTGIVTVTDATGALNAVDLPNELRDTYNRNTKYVNASPVRRYGIEWIADFAQIETLHTQIRLDGNYYHYKGLDETLFCDVPMGINSRQSDGKLYQYIGYYRGSNATSTGYSANASVNNGTISRQVNLNATITTHIPKIRMIMALRIECSLYHYDKALCEYEDGYRGYAVTKSSDNFGIPYNGSIENQYVVVYPEYYSTWNNPNTLIPFTEKYVWARKNDQDLYNDLSKLVVRSNYPYTLNANRLSKYYSVNFSVTKEIGDHISISFYANNFFNNMNKVQSSQTDLETTLFGSGYIPSFYYGLSLQLKI